MPQNIASIARQVLALLGITFGVLTASVSTLHLPTAVSAALTVGGTLILAIEHYVSDPSTGNPVSTTTTTTSTPAPAPAPAPAPVLAPPAAAPTIPQTPAA